ncbi:D-2-hydroxyacid dehydrogenase family protein [Profundibacterium mesophilum]|uniref:D-3-phosphoglycerate dehydrogenase n=1 Tax=Profundibacterium mesophilum KAUST100406-0324 TaxID=1037889 RepID=A0A921NUF2_9RHOB|nr:D-2-hydroxyacid dehydrogenase family protein [Profundibacterium mesophilum]KAF0676849.1 D-3-phosphoglycerate dehydrogenase [Profundibacterium mesophilum KAUST100406-0324]
MKVHILDDWFDTLRGLPCYSKLGGHDVAVWTDHVDDVEELAHRLRGAEALVLFRERTKITRDLLERLPKLELISQRSVYPHVDVGACTDHGVLLCSNMHADTPSYAAAELTWGLILSAMRQIPQQMASTRTGHWQIGVGKTLRGRRLGLYGYGRIAKTVAGYAEAFGMEVVWWASEEGRARVEADGARLATSRAAFFSESDVISLHVRLKPNTRGIVTFDDLSEMQPGAVLVNTSRAGLIASGALLAALDRGRPGMAAIDVFDHEPMTDPDDPLLAHPNLICTPHIGFVTEDEFELQFADIFDQIVAYAAGMPINVINPEARPGA